MNHYLAAGLEFWVPGEPHAAQRPQVTKRGTYTPRATLEAEARVAHAFRVAYPRWTKADTDHGWSLEITLFRGVRIRRDVDNMAKTIMDGLNGTLYRDDFQVLRLIIEQEVTPKREVPGARVVAHSSLGVGYWITTPKASTP